MLKRKHCGRVTGGHADFPRQIPKLSLYAAKNTRAGSIAINKQLLAQLRECIQKSAASESRSNEAEIREDPVGALNSRLVAAASAVESSGAPEGTPELTTTKIEAQDDFQRPEAEPTSGEPLPPAAQSLS